MRELTAAREAQTSLKTEIASLTALIESAEMRSATRLTARDIGLYENNTVYK